MGGMFSFFNDIDNYESRKINLSSIGGLEISTVWTSDEGYETAIIDANGEVSPVQRYPDKEEAEEGHRKWERFCKNSKNTHVTKLGGLGGLVGEVIVKLARKKTKKRMA